MVALIRFHQRKRRRISNPNNAHPYRTDPNNTIGWSERHSAGCFHHARGYDRHVVLPDHLPEKPQAVHELVVTDPYSIIANVPNQVEQHAVAVCVGLPTHHVPGIDRQDIGMLQPDLIEICGAFRQTAEGVTGSVAHFELTVGIAGVKNHQ